MKRSVEKKFKSELRVWGKNVEDGFTPLWTKSASILDLITDFCFF